ncbi:MAG: sugar ABC transporter substrate-binding protein, partial [Clostridia bacterium]|nr:sugar ABC transporter substrate-binding protein [Clostridia bacterium]
MKKMRKNFLWLIVVISLIGLLLVGCGGGDKPKEEQPKAEEKVFKVGINNFGQANFFARVGREAMIEQIEKNGGEVIATVTADVPSRLAAIENMIVQGVDAIIIQEGDITQVAPALIEAKEKGIIIGSMDAGDADFVDVFVESDNNHLGTAAAEKMVELIGGKGNIVEIFNDAGSMIRVRRNAMHEVIKAYPEIKIVAGFTYAWPDFFPDGKAKMEAILQAHPNPGDIAAVYATFDGVGLAAAQA